MIADWGMTIFILNKTNKCFSRFQSELNRDTLQNENDNIFFLNKKQSHFRVRAYIILFKPVCT